MRWKWKWQLSGTVCVLVLVVIAGSASVCGGSEVASALSEGVSVACNGRGLCAAVGENAKSTGGGALYSDSGGRSWQEVPVNAPGTVLLSVSCITGGRCVAVGTSPSGGLIYWGHAFGEDWSPARTLPLAGADAAACMTTGSCIVVGSPNIIYTDDEGASWQIGHHAPDDLPDAISCWNGHSCVGVGVGNAGSLAMITSDAGVNWRTVELPSGSGPGLVSVSCVEPNTCVAVGTTVSLTSVDGGVRWKEERLPSRLGLATSVSCVPNGACVVGGTGSSGATPVGYSRDFGQKWFLSKEDGGLGGIRSVDCFTAASCIAVGIVRTGNGAIFGAIETHSAGHRWN